VAPGVRRCKAGQEQPRQRRSRFRSSRRGGAARGWGGCRNSPASQPKSMSMANKLAASKLHLGLVSHVCLAARVIFCFSPAARRASTSAKRNALSNASNSRCVPCRVDVKEFVAPAVNTDCDRKEWLPGAADWRLSEPTLDPPANTTKKPNPLATCMFGATGISSVHINVDHGNQNGYQDWSRSVAWGRPDYAKHRVLDFPWNRLSGDG